MLYIKPIPEQLLAEAFHEIYEVVSRNEGWETNETTRVKFSDLKNASPENYNTMINTCRLLIQKFGLLQSQNSHEIYENVDMQNITLDAG